MGVPFNPTTKSAVSSINPVAAAGIQLGTGLIDNLFNIGQKKKQREHENELAKYQYEQQKEMIREQNLYNAPKNQMKLYEEGGLNPHLAAGKFEPQSQIAKFQAPQQEYGSLDMGTPLGGAIGSFQQAKMQSAQISQIQAQTNTQNQLARNAAYSGLGILADNKKKNALMPTHLENAQAQIANLQASKGLTDQKSATEEHKTREQKARADLAEKGIFPGDNNYKIELKKAINYIKTKGYDLLDRGGFIPIQWK